MAGGAAVRGAVCVQLGLGAEEGEREGVCFQRRKGASLSGLGTRWSHLLDIRAIGLVDLSTGGGSVSSVSPPFPFRSLVFS